MLCPACTADVPEEDLFCEECGHRLTEVTAPDVVPRACVCGAALGEVDDDGFCLQCGRRVRRPASDHVEEGPSPRFAAVSDRGQRHDRNEDRFALYVDPDAHVLVVCDGVSSTRTSEIASAAISEGVRDALAARLADGSAAADPKSALLAAIASSAAGLRQQSQHLLAEKSPSTTLVAALVIAGVAYVAWVGDSRAYWLDASGAKLLTRDHSWRNQVVISGEMSAEQADHAPQAHAITRWLSADASEADQAVPELVEVPLTAPGTLMLCTDGLWNYAQAEEQIAELFSPASVGTEDALATCQRLVQFANQAGGQDNITVALLVLRASASPAQAPGTTPGEVNCEDTKDEPQT